MQSNQLFVPTITTILVIFIYLFIYFLWQERIARVNNAIESIVRSLARQIGESKLALQLLLELSRSNLVRDFIGNVQGCIFLLVTISSGDDTQAAKDAKELLENLSFLDQNVIQMARANYFKPLLRLLSSGIVLMMCFLISIHYQIQYEVF